ncbi:interferon-induced protein 35 [Triplophysa dalaica]|uniref:interferon-induced protein 35 n=1 Tax=Triplophysa dalaica TaxID=1582913 RepID=UPI0024DF52D2|nr:interferon-induced protein 35 [Triplophysa dalaica]XP_056608976.1 interferon-induced protein 35 [Triplophysa dalaica]XP_056608977.1 interferon-induced protein 35 [Triplophysa dalaica]
MTTEEFSLINGESLGTLENIQKEINKYKNQYDALVKDQNIFKDAIDSNKNYAKLFQERREEKKMSLDTDKKKHKEKIQKEVEQQRSVQKEHERLRAEIIRIKEELDCLEKKNDHLKQQTEVSTAVPEKKVVFKGKTEEGAHALSFDVSPRIVYPMEGGTALITFEDVGVAMKILSMKEHSVQLGECVINVQVKPVQFLVPGYIEMDTQVCPRRILVSNLPSKLSEDKLLDKLEIHFSKTRNGGGEVEEIDMLHDSGTVVVTFVDDSVAKGLTDQQDHKVDIAKNQKHKVKVTPFLNGEISQLHTRDSVCLRTVQLTAIPAIMEQDNLQDHLEIHFQKAANGGGEVESIIYNPMGHTTLAVFVEDSVEVSY